MTVIRPAGVREAVHQEAQDGAWPDGVTFRFLTIVGATVDLRPHTNGDDQPHDDVYLTGECTGCAHKVHDLPHRAKDTAQDHAEKCRALPRPSGD